MGRRLCTRVVIGYGLERRRGRIRGVHVHARERVVRVRKDEDLAHTLVEHVDESPRGTAIDERRIEGPIDRQSQFARARGLIAALVGEVRQAVAVVVDAVGAPRQDLAVRVVGTRRIEPVGQPIVVVVETVGAGREARE